MQKFDHVLLASDFDNTLVYTQSALDNGTDIPPMCPRNREALDYFIQNGGLFAISTGRALPAFMDYAKDVPMSAPCVIANGAAIYDFRANEYLYTAFLGKAIYDHMAEVLARFPTLAFEVYHDDCRIHAMNPNRYIRNHEHLTRSPVQVVERFTDIDLPIIKILFEEDFPVLDAVRTFILSRPWGREYELIYSNEHLLELTAAGATKGGMILRLASLLGVDMLMQTVLDLVPVATDMPAEAAQDDDGNAVEVAHDENGATAAIVFKTVSDQYGKFSLVKVVRGKITGDMSLYDTTTGNTEKLGRLYTLKGKKNEEVKEICCGDIGAIAKMDRVKTGDTLCDPKSIVKLAGMPYAEPCYSRAIAPKTRGQEEKLGTGLNRLNEEDPTFTVVNNAETHQMVVSGAGDIQIDVLVSKLKTRFGVDAELDTPRVPYREKIRKTVQKQGRHKKQTGGSGQFGDVWVRFEPNEESEEMVFAEEVFGGSVPKNFFPAVEKGLREAVLHGPLAGYPVVNLKCVLYDGSYHPVDSSEIAFKTAANLAYKAAMPEASPVLLEPVCELKVTVPDQYMGDILGDLNKRRGRVMGMTPTGDGEQIIEAECPEAELMSYAIDLRSMTQSRGSFTMHFVRYEQCSADAQEKAVAAAKAMQEAE